MPWPSLALACSSLEFSFEIRNAKAGSTAFGTPRPPRPLRPHGYQVVSLVTDSRVSGFPFVKIPIFYRKQIPEKNENPKSLSCATFFLLKKNFVFFQKINDFLKKWKQLKKDNFLEPKSCQNRPQSTKNVSFCYIKA